MRKLFLTINTVLILFIGCTKYTWKTVTSDSEDKVNILAVASLDSTMKSFVKVHHTLSPDKDENFFLRYDTVAYDSGHYDYFYEKVNKLNYENGISSVIISNSDGDFVFFPVLLKYNRIFNTKEVGYRIFEEIVYLDTLNVFKPKPKQTQFLKVITPDGKVVTGETITPEFIKTESLPDTLFSGNDLTIIL